MTTKIMGDYEIKGTEKQVNEIYHMYMFESLNRRTFKMYKKYFNIWVHNGTGIYAFPKEKYFVSRKGETNYAVALLQYGSNADVESAFYENE